jgi:hypothetical protein
MELVFESWWKAWYNEKISEFVAKPRKWARSDRPLHVGNIVLFQKTGEEQVLGQPIWRIGRVVAVEVSAKDSQVRAVTIEYKNSGENVFRTTRRAARKVAVLYREDELEMVQQLNAAAREADRLGSKSEAYLAQQVAVCRDVEVCVHCSAPFMCMRHYQFFERNPYVPAPLSPEEGLDLKNVALSGEDMCSDSSCESCGIHVDPWAGKVVVQQAGEC